MGLYYYKPILLCTKNVFVLFLSGLPTWRLMYVYSITHKVGFSPVLYCLPNVTIPLGNPFKCHEEVLYLQSMILPKRFDIFHPDWGCSEGLDAFNDIPKTWNS